jgi:hypothetical protein
MAEARPNISHVEQAMGRAVKAVEEEFKPIFGRRAVVVVNVATKDWAFGSSLGAQKASAGAFEHAAASLRQSAEEAEL